MTGQPVRTCVGCRRRAPATELIRIRADPSGELRIGPGPGRGAWLCDTPECRERGMTAAVLGRALRVEVKPTSVARLRDSWSRDPQASPRVRSRDRSG